MLQWRYCGSEIWLNLFDLSVLKGQDGRNGSSGQNGADGNTPFIGENGTWWIGNTDTGIKAAGAKKGKREMPGKTAHARDIFMQRQAVCPMFC